MDKKEFEQQKELIELEFERKMEYSKFIRETERLKHEWDMEQHRIKRKDNVDAMLLKNKLIREGKHS